MNDGDLTPRSAIRGPLSGLRTAGGGLRTAGRGLRFAVCMIPFVLLATLNSAGYRYGASDQAFYLPAILERLGPTLFPRDSALIQSQARLTVVDETVAGVARASGLGLPELFAVLYVAALALLAWGALSIGRELYATQAAAIALLFALALRHAITKTGTNTLEGYFHPRQLAFALGVLAVAGYLRNGFAWAPIVLLAVAALVHPTTALWFIVWIGVALFVSERKLRGVLAALAVAGAAAAGWALSSGPLEGRLVRMDEEWLATLSSKDYLFPLQWPISAWLINLAYVPIILWVYVRRRAAGVLIERETAMVAGCLSLVAAFALALSFQANRIALAIQLQPARIFWMLDLLATAYVVWAAAEGHGETRRKGAVERHPTTRTGRAAIVATVVLALAIVRGGYVAYVRFPERSLAQIDVPDTDWGRAMAWARASDKASHWVADPFHAARYGTSVRVAGHRDVLVEEIKDAAIGMYDRNVAMRTSQRVRELGPFGELTAERARGLAEKYDLDYLITEQQLDLPVAFSSGSLQVYALR